MAKRVHPPRQRSGYWVPAPSRYRVVYDGGQPSNVDPSQGAYSTGQYADPDTGTVHTTRGVSRRALAQDVGQLLFANDLSAGDRHYFMRLLGMQGHPMTNYYGAKSVGATNNPVDEAFSDYYALAATGGVAPGMSVTMGDTSIDPKTLRKVARALKRFGRRHHLRHYQ